MTATDRRPAAMLRRGRLSWRRWRRTRPFWGGLFVLLGGGEIVTTVRAPLPVVVHFGLIGTASYVVPLVIMLCGLLILVNPAQRLFYSLLALVLTLVSWVTSNLGGFFIGLLLGLLGGSLAFAWAPTRPKPVVRVPDSDESPATS